MDSHEIRMIEFFSGIGGMRYGMEQALEAINNAYQTTHRLSLCVAYDISLHANRTYQYNNERMFSSSEEKSPPNSTTCKLGGISTIIHTKLIEQLTSQDIKQYQANVWTLSPPCQPFTQRNNNVEHRRQRDDVVDPRNQALLHICTTLLPSLQEHKPRWIFLENVQNFYNSTMYSIWCRTLINCGYTFVPYLLNPATSLGVPNNRTRFYMTCQLTSSNNVSHVQQPLQTALIPNSCSNPTKEDNSIMEDTINEHTLCPHSTPPRKPLSRYLQLDSTEEEIAPYLLTHSQLQQRWSTYLSIVTPADDITYCFTAGYSRILHKSTGSVLLSHTPTTTTAISIDKTNLLQYHGRIRRFTPKEICNLLGFPKSFQFPIDDIPLAQQYKMIGNSIHVTLVAKLLEKLFLPSLDSGINEVTQQQKT